MNKQTADTNLVQEIIRELHASGDSGKSFRTGPYGKAASKDKAWGTTARVYSVVPLADEEKKNLTKALERYAKKQISLVFEERPELLGGLRIEMEDTVMDMSLSGYLMKVKRMLLTEETI